MKVWRVPYPKFGDGPGLERVSALAAHLGLELAAFGAGGAVIVGSNGKGSTAAMCASLLRQTGRRIGLFTSPHLLSLNERFRIDDEDISDAELETHWARVAAAIEALGLAAHVGAFEFLFLIAADWFAARDCAHTVWEAGLGGRLDPVRLIAARRVALTALDLEHTALLGETLSAIALEKAAAAPAGARLFSATLDADVQAALATDCASRGVALQIVDGEPPGAPALAGAHQCDNAALALALARDIVPLSDAQALDGLTQVRWRGRLQAIANAPLTVIDVGHTPRAIEAALAGFEIMRGVRDAVLVCGASSDKDGAALVGKLAARFPLIICAAASHKGAPAASVAKWARAANAEAEIVLSESIGEARQLARRRAGPGGAVFVAGGLFLAAEFLAVSCGLNPENLSFL